MRKSLLVALSGPLILPFASGCTTLRETQPAHTATEELLESHAAEMAADRLAGALPPRAAVFIDTTHFKGDNSDYAISALDAAFLRHGMILTPDKKSSKVTVELRMGALSIDQKDTVFGLPAGSLPIPGTITAFPIPEISFYSSNHRTGKAEFAAIAYNSATGAPIAFAGPVGAQRDLVERRYLTLIHTGERMERPAGVNRKGQEVNHPSPPPPPSTADHSE